MQKDVVDGGVVHHIHRQEIRDKGVGFIWLLGRFFIPGAVAVFITIGASYVIAHWWAHQSTMVVWSAANWGLRNGNTVGHRMGRRAPVHRRWHIR